MRLLRTTWRPSSVSFLLHCLITLLCSGVMVVGTPVRTKPDFEGRVRYSLQEIRRAITFYATRYRLDPALLHAVIKVESGFRPDAVSRKGAVGLMQLKPETTLRLKVNDAYDPLQNIRGGAKQLRHLLNVYEGDLRLALAAYNAGIHRVKGGRIQRIGETRSYVRKVLWYYERNRMRRPCRTQKAKTILCESSRHGYHRFVAANH